MILNVFLHLLIVLVALGGFSIAFYIHHKKSRNEKLVCPLESNCEVVVRSRYSRFFGLPLEFLGMGYYVLAAVSHALFLIFPDFHQGGAIMVIMIVTVLATIFSLYLTYLQAVKLKEWCTWCLTSALFCAIIFFASLALG